LVVAGPRRLRIARIALENANAKTIDVTTANRALCDTKIFYSSKRRATIVQNSPLEFFCRTGLGGILYGGMQLKILRVKGAEDPSTLESYSVKLLVRDPRSHSNPNILELDLVFDTSSGSVFGNGERIEIGLFEVPTNVRRKHEPAFVLGMRAVDIDEEVHWYVPAVPEFMLAMSAAVVAAARRYQVDEIAALYSNGVILASGTPTYTNPRAHKQTNMSVPGGLLRTTLWKVLPNGTPRMNPIPFVVADFDNHVDTCVLKLSLTETEKHDKPHQKADVQSSLGFPDPLVTNGKRCTIGVCNQTLKFKLHIDQESGGIVEDSWMHVDPCSRDSVQTMEAVVYDAVCAAVNLGQASEYRDWMLLHTKNKAETYVGEYPTNVVAMLDIKKSTAKAELRASSHLGKTIRNWFRDGNLIPGTYVIELDPAPGDTRLVVVCERREQNRSGTVTIKWVVYYKLETITRKRKREYRVRLPKALDSAIEASSSVASPWYAIRLTARGGLGAMHLHQNFVAADADNSNPVWDSRVYDFDTEHSRRLFDEKMTNSLTLLCASTGQKVLIESNTTNTRSSLFDVLLTTE
jgi:hypothetical protein